jgi:signal transduction histidine kinase
MSDETYSILVVEDEEIIRSVFTETFQAWGYEVDSAANGKEALEKTQHKQYDIIITDLNMPFVNGIELIKKLKDKNYLAEIIVITGFATIDNAIEAMKAGAFDFITKPVNFDHVQFVINKCKQQIKSREENSQLRILNERLTKLNEIKDKFISITNHELRTPVTIIKGYLDVLEMSVDEEQEELKEIVDILKFSVNELIDRLENIHNLSQLDKKNLPFNFEEGNLSPYLIEALKEISILYKKRNIKLKLKTFPKVVKVYADFYRMKQVFREMLQNALKFTPDGGDVTVSGTVVENKVFIVFEDTGIGIPPTEQKLIFEPFYEVQDIVHHKTSQTEFMGGGLGIGLSLVKEIITAHHGSIEVESEPGKGSKFMITIPTMDHPDIQNQLNLSESGKLVN